MLVSNTRVTAQVGGINIGVCAFKGGGQTEAEETKYRPGSMEPQQSLGGPIAVENVTVRKLFDPQLRSLFHTLHAMCGKASMTITSQPLDADGNPEGRAQVYRGILTRVTPPDSDANATDAAELELEMSTHGSIA
jgi:hypothetical protein